MKSNNQQSMKTETPTYRTFTVIVDPEYFEVDKHKEGTFKLLVEEGVDFSVERLNKFFYEIVSSEYKPKKVSKLFWFENTEKELV
jgi:hypothetical protein